MILGAAVLVSAVAWTFLSPVGQALLLCAVVLALGIVTIAIKRRVPTTSTILAGLTAAMAVVVVLGLPTLLPEMPVLPYVVAAAIGLNAALLAAGRAGGVTLWRHLGWAATPLTAGVVVYAVLDPEAWTAPQWPMTAVLLAVAAVGLQSLAVQQFRGDIETAVTAGWAGFATTLLVIAAAALAVEDLLAGDPATVGARLWVGAAIAALAAALAAAMPLLRQIFGDRARMADGMWAAVLALSVVIVAAPTAVSSAGSALLLPAVTALMLTVAALLLRTAPTGAAQQVGLFWFGGTLVWTPVWLVAIARTQGERGEWYWLSDLLVALLLGGAISAWGARRRVGGPFAAGATVMVVAWLYSWAQGHLGDSVEALTLPVLTMLAGQDLLASRRLAASPVNAPARLVVIALFTLPTVVPALTGYADTGLVSWWPALVIALLLSLMTAVGWRHRGGRTAAAAAAGAVAASFALASLQSYPGTVPEVITGIIALSLMVPLYVAQSEGLIGNRMVAPVLGASAFLVPSYVIAWSDPEFVLDGAVLRGGFVVLALAGLVVVWRRAVPVVCLVAGVLGLVLVGWWWGWFVSASSAAEFPEAWTVPWAVLATAGVGLFAWLFPARAAVWWGYLVPPALIVVAPSYVVALGDPEFVLDGAVLRGGFVVLALAGLVVVWRRAVPVVCLVAGVLGLVLVGWWWGWFVSASSAAEFPEAWTVPWAVLATAGVGLFAWLFPARAAVWWGYLVPAALIVVAPSYLVALGDPEFVLDGAAARGITLIALSAGITVLTWRMPLVAATAGSAGLLLLAEWWGVRVAQSSVADVPEVWAVPWAALATAGLALWLRAAAMSRSNRIALLLLPAAVTLLVSAAAAVVLPLGTSGIGEDVRAVTVVLMLWGLTVALRGRPALTAIAGTGAAAMTWYQLVSVVGGRYPDAPLELYTWPGAVALAVVTALTLRARSRPVSTMLSMAPTISVALLPTALLAWSTGEAGWRVWVCLIAAGGLLVAGVAEKWAGVVYPSLLAIAVVLVPVLTRLAQDLPAYVPLSIVGVLLLIIGARLEAVRRHGRELTHWGSLLH